MSIETIDGFLCVIGHNQDTNHIYDYNNYSMFLKYGFDEDLYTYGHCPMCGDYITCDYVVNPKWLFQKTIPRKGTYEVLSIEDEGNSCVYPHHFIATYEVKTTDTENIISTNRPFKSLLVTLNQIIPERTSSITKLILEKYLLVLWYEQEISNLLDENVTYPEEKYQLLYNLSWNNTLKCQIFSKFSTITGKDIAHMICKFIDWFCMKK